MITVFDKFILILLGVGGAFGLSIMVAFIMTRVGDGDFNGLKARVEHLEHILEKKEGYQ